MTITLKDSTTPRIIISDAGNNVLIGSDISTITTGIQIVTLGIGAGSSLTSAQSIIAIGKDSQKVNAEAFFNISIGNSSMLSLNDTVSDSRFNCVIGNFALASATTAVSRCVALGDTTLFTVATNSSSLIAIGVNAAGSINTNSSNSIFIGDSAGLSITDCTFCTLIGDRATLGTVSGLTNSMALGANTTVNASNAVNIGSGCNVGLNNVSPAYNLDIATISNVAAIRVADSSSTPSTPSGAALYYSVSGIPTYMNSNAVARAIPHRTSVTVAGTTATFALTDTDTFQVTTNAATITLTVPTNASVAFPVDTEIDVFQQGTGQVVFAAAGGVTIQSFNSNLKIAAQFTGATLKKLATNTWALTGNLTA